MSNRFAETGEGRLLMRILLLAVEDTRRGDGEAKQFLSECGNEALEDLGICATVEAFLAKSTQGCAVLV